MKQKYDFTTIAHAALLLGFLAMSIVAMFEMKKTSQFIAVGLLDVAIVWCLNELRKY